MRKSFLYGEIYNKRDMFDMHLFVLFSEYISVFTVLNHVIVGWSILLITF